MNSFEQHAIRRLPACGLPAWWRCLLVALATIIMCSCSRPLTATAQGIDADTVIISDNDGATVSDNVPPTPSGMAPSRVRFFCGVQRSSTSLVPR